MSVAWDQVEAACEAWATRVLNGAAPTTPLAVPVVWKDRAHPDVRSPSIELAIDGEKSVGVDDVEYDYSGSTMVPTVTGYREFTLEVQCRSRDQSTTKTARNYLESLRSSLFHPYFVGLLEVGGVAFHTAQPVRTIPYVNEGRKESLALLEIHCGVTASLYDASAPIDYADSADVSVSVNGDAPIVVDLPES